MNDVYERCPAFENPSYKLRLVSPADCANLLEVYSDEKAVPFFNSDNCHGDDFHYTTEIRMKEAIEYWLSEYAGKGFVRWAVIDKRSEEAIGTIELFHRNAKDYFTECGLLRLDLRSDYEISTEIQSILSLILFPAFDLFSCGKIATKAIPEATQRVCALKQLGFAPSVEKLIGHNGTKYGFYFVLTKSDNATE